MREILIFIPVWGRTMEKPIDRLRRTGRLFLV